MEIDNYLEVVNLEVSSANVNVTDKEELFSYAAQKLEENGVLESAEDFKRDLYYRESLGKTGIGEGIAIPHGKSKSVRKTCIALFRLKQPIEWETTDDKPVQVIILFAVSIADQNEVFLRMMAQVARRLAREGVCRQLAAAPTTREMLQALQ